MIFAALLFDESSSVSSAFETEHMYPPTFSIKFDNNSKKNSALYVLLRLQGGGQVS